MEVPRLVTLEQAPGARPIGIPEVGSVSALHPCLYTSAHPPSTVGPLAQQAKASGDTCTRQGTGMTTIANRVSQAAGSRDAFGAPCQESICSLASACHRGRLLNSW